jgi:hypothetical protein
LADVFKYISNVLCWYKHVEYPAVSVSRKLLSGTPPETSPYINAITASREGNLSKALFTRTF